MSFCDIILFIFKCFFVIWGDKFFVVILLLGVFCISDGARGLTEYLKEFFIRIFFFRAGRRDRKVGVNFFRVLGLFRRV